MALADVQDAAATAEQSAQSEPTNWVEECYIDATICDRLLSGTYATYMTTACLTDTATFDNNADKAMCVR